MDALLSALADDRPDLVVPWHELSAIVQPRAGDLVIVSGAPKAGKSAFTLAWALRTKEPTRLVSLDTPSQTQAARVAAHLTGRSVSDFFADRALLHDTLEAQSLSMLTLDRPLPPSQLGELIEADMEYWGERPALLLLDDVSRMELGTRGYEEWMKAYVDMAHTSHRTGTTIMAIHHFNAVGMSRTIQPKMQYLQYAPGYLPEVVLGVWRPTDHELRVSVLANRNGEDDPDGGLYVSFDVDLARMRLAPRRPGTGVVNAKAASGPDFYDAFRRRQEESWVAV